MAYMKRPLLIFSILLLSQVAVAQTKLYYDAKQNANILLEDWRELYGKVSADSVAKANADYQDAPKEKVLPKPKPEPTVVSAPKVKVEKPVPAPKVAQSDKSYPTTPKLFGTYTLKMDPENLAVGCSMVGVSAAAYFIGASLCDDASARKVTEATQMYTAAQEAYTKGYNDLTDQKNRGLMSDRRYTEGVAALQKTLDAANAAAKAKSDETDNLRRTKSTIGYIAGGVSLVGVVVVLTGLSKEYNAGLKVSRNTYFNTTETGFSLTKRF